MKKIIGIGIIIAALLTASALQHSYAQLGTLKPCSSYKLKVFDITSDEILKSFKDFISKNSIRSLSGQVFSTTSRLFVNYCETEQSQCTINVELVTASGGQEFEQKFNAFTKGKNIIDATYLFWETHTDAYVLYCASSISQQQTQKSTPQPQSKPPVIKKELVVTQPLKISKGDMIGIRSIVKNLQPAKMNFTYIVQIKDEFGSVLFLTWVQDLSVLMNDSVTPTIFWLAENKGKYQAEVFVWESVDNPTPLAPVKSISFEV